MRGVHARAGAHVGLVVPVVARALAGLGAGHALILRLVRAAIAGLPRAVRQAGEVLLTLHGGRHELRAPGGHLRRVDRLVQLLDRRVRADRQLLADAFVVEVHDGAERAIDALGRLDAPGVRDALLHAEALPRGEVVVAPGQILEAHARHAKANALVAALDRRVIPREPTAAAEGRLSLVVDGVLVGALARLAQLGIEHAVLMPHIEDGRRRRHLLLSQLRNRGFVADAGAGHANGRALLVVGRLLSRLDCRATYCVEGPRIDGPRLRVADRQGGAKEAQHLGSPFARHGR